MLSHTWTKPDRRNLQTYDTYGAETSYTEQGPPGPGKGPEAGPGDYKPRNSAPSANSSYIISALAGLAGLVALAYV